MKKLILLLVSFFTGSLQVLVPTSSQLANYSHMKEHILGCQRLPLTDEAIAFIESRIGYTFQNKSILRHAFNVGSRQSKNFALYGDSLLDKWVINQLKMFNIEFTSQDHHKMKSSLVNNNLLAELCIQLDLFYYIQTDRPLRFKQLADLIEAIIYAIKLDNHGQASWADTEHQFLEKFWRPLLKNPPILSTNSQLLRDCSNQGSYCSMFSSKVLKFNLGDLNELWPFLDEEIKVAISWRIKLDNSKFFVSARDPEIDMYLLKYVAERIALQQNKLENYAVTFFNPGHNILDLLKEQQ